MSLFQLLLCHQCQGEVHELLDDDDDDVDVDQLHGDEHLRLHHLLSHWLHTCHVSQRLKGAEEKLISIKCLVLVSSF